MADRSEKFKRWLTDLTPEKMALLIQMEKVNRMITHVYQINGTHDEKLLDSLHKVSMELRAAYEDKYVEENPASVGNIQPA